MSSCRHKLRRNAEGNQHGSLCYILTINSVTTLMTSHNTEGNQFGALHAFLFQCKQHWRKKHQQQQAIPCNV
jgi:hypothetical protein